MKFTVEAKTLKDIIKVVNTAISDKLESVDSIYGFVLLEGHRDGGFIKMTAINQSVTLTSVLSADVEEDFTVGLPYKQLNSLLQGLTDEVTFDTEKMAPGWIQMRGRKNKYKMPAKTKESFPIEERSFKTFARLHAETLRDVLTISSFTTNKLDNSAWTMRCVNIKTEFDSESVEKENRIDKISFISTDGMQMGAMILDNSDYVLDVFNEVSLLVPAQNLAMLISLCKACSPDSVMDLRISDNGNKFMVRNEFFSLSTSLTAGTFPDVAQIIDRVQITESFVVDRPKMQEAIKRLVSMAKDSAIWATVDSHNNQLILETNEDPDLGVGQEIIDLREININGEETLKTGFNVNQLSGLLSVLSGELLFGLKLDKIPHLNYIKVYPVDNVLNYFYVTTPVRKQNEFDDVDI